MITAEELRRQLEPIRPDQEIKIWVDGHGALPIKDRLFISPDGVWIEAEEEK